MKSKVPDMLEKFRQEGPRGEFFGRFLVRYQQGILHVVAAKGTTETWAEMGLPGPPFDHVSVSIPGSFETPTWEMMCHVKDLFWDDDECVIQYHPPKKDYVNYHKGVLHMWKPLGVDIPMPPKRCI